MGQEMGAGLGAAVVRNMRAHAAEKYQLAFIKNRPDENPVGQVNRPRFEGMVGQKRLEKCLK